MRYGILSLFVFIAAIVFETTIRGLVRHDFSASGVRITRKSSPLAFWLTATWHLLVCALMIALVFIAAKKTFT